MLSYVKYPGAVGRRNISFGASVLLGLQQNPSMDMKKTNYIWTQNECCCAEEITHFVLKVHELEFPLKDKKFCSKHPSHSWPGWSRVRNESR